MKGTFLLPVVFFVLSGVFLSVSMGLFFLAGRSFGAEGEGEMILPVVIEPPAETLFTTSIFEKVASEKSSDSYLSSKYFPRNITPLHADNLDVTARAYAVMDRETGELLLGKNITGELPIASLTKVMTALIALEKEDIKRELVVTKAAASVGEAEMGLTEGERLPLEDLLYGLLMISGNDAAETIAAGLGRGRYWFIEEMNKKAYDLGLKDTYFVNPTGLDGDTPGTSTFSTALDLLALSNYALFDPVFAEIVGTKYHEISYKENYHKAFFLDSILSFEQTYPGIRGIKTGNTDFAGQTLISYDEHEERKILVVLLGSEGSKDDAVKLYKWVFGEDIVTSQR